MRVKHRWKGELIRCVAKFIHIKEHIILDKQITLVRVVVKAPPLA